MDAEDQACSDESVSSGSNEEAHEGSEQKLQQSTALPAADGHAQAQHAAWQSWRTGDVVAEDVLSQLARSEEGRAAAEAGASSAAGACAAAEARLAEAQERAGSAWEQVHELSARLEEAERGRQQGQALLRRAAAECAACRARLPGEARARRLRCAEGAAAGEGAGRVQAEEPACGVDEQGGLARRESSEEPRDGLRASDASPHLESMCRQARCSCFLLLQTLHR